MPFLPFRWHGYFFTTAYQITGIGNSLKKEELCEDKADLPQMAEIKKPAGI